MRVGLVVERRYFAEPVAAVEGLRFGQGLVGLESPRARSVSPVSSSDGRTNGGSPRPGSKSDSRRHPSGTPTHRPRTGCRAREPGDRKSTRLNSSHLVISYAVFCLKKKKCPQPPSPVPSNSTTP